MVNISTSTTVYSVEDGFVQSRNEDGVVFYFADLGGTEVGDQVAITATVLNPKGMPKVAGLEDVERQSLTD